MNNVLNCFLIYLNSLKFSPTFVQGSSMFLGVFTCVRSFWTVFLKSRILELAHFALHDPDMTGSVTDILVTNQLNKNAIIKF